MTYPACFDSQAQYDEWLAAAVEVAVLSRDTNPDGSPRPVPYCTDCTPAYKARMHARRRCGHPRVTFIRVGTEGDAYYGRRPRG